MRQLFRRLLGRSSSTTPGPEARVPASVGLPAEPKLARGTANGQTVPTNPVDTPKPFALFSSAESVRPRQYDGARAASLAEAVLTELDTKDVALPPSPVMALRVSVFLKKGDPDTNELIKLIGQDAAMAAKVLQVANSALYSPTRAVDTIRAAVVSMGTKAVSTLVLGEATRSMFDSGARAMPDSYRHLSARIFHDSATASHGAGALAIAINRGRIDRVFLGGMIHDIGKPLALRVLAALENRPADLDLIEAVVESVHVAAGRLLLQRWELPDGLIELCARHHDDVIEPGTDGDDMHVLRVASGIVAHLRGATPESLHAQVLHSINALKITRDHTKVLVADAREHSRVVTSSYGLDAAHAFVAPGAPTTRPSQQRPTGSRDPA